MTPGLLLFGVWFALSPRSMTALRMCSLSDDMQIAFTANAFVLAALGGLSLWLVA